jgi:WD40 repeat protein
MRNHRIFGWLLAALALLAYQQVGLADDVRSPDGKLVAAGDGNDIVLTDAATQKELVRIKGHTGKVTALAFSPDGKVLASGGADKKVCLWDVATGKQVRKLDGGDTIEAVSFSKDGKTLTAREPGKVQREWDVATGKLLREDK